MLYSKIKELKQELVRIGLDNWREVLDNAGNEDFEVDDYRFIEADSIDRIMQEELTSDLYVLGCAADWFLADVLNIPLSAVRAIQAAEAFEALGEMVISMGKLSEYQQGIVNYDGYGSCVISIGDCSYHVLEV